MQKSLFSRDVLNGGKVIGEDSARAKVKSEVTELYESFAQDLFRYLLCLTRNIDLAQEAVQETFLRYYEYRLRNGSLLESRGWFFRVARNFVIDQLRATKPDKHVSLDSVPIGPDAGPGPEELAAHLESLDQLATLLAPRELECLQLRAEGFKYREIGEILGIESGTVGATIAHGLKKIRTFYVDKKEDA